jgi:uncharacterized membrane protein
MTRVATAAVAGVGLAIAGYLVLAGGHPVCVAGGGCAAVQQSDYAHLGGVPVAALGLVGYAAILASLLRDGEIARTVTAGLAFTGFGFSAWLTWVSHTEVGALCAWCVASALCMTALAVLAGVRAVRA